MCTPHHGPCERGREDMIGERELEREREREREISMLSDFTDIDNDASLQDALKAYQPDLNIPTNDFNLQHFSYKNFGILNLTIGHFNEINYTGLTVSAACRIRFSF